MDQTQFPVSCAATEDAGDQEPSILGATLRKTDRTLPARSDGAQIGRDRVAVRKGELVLRPRDGAYPRARISRAIGGLIKKFLAGAKLAPYPEKHRAKWLVALHRFNR